MLNAGTVLRVNETYGSEPGDQRLVDAAGDHGRPLRPLRDADEFLRDATGLRTTKNTKRTKDTKKKDMYEVFFVSFVAFVVFVVPSGR